MYPLDTGVAHGMVRDLNIIIQTDTKLWPSQTVF